MARSVKEFILNELKGRLSDRDGMVLVDTTGLDAQNAEEIRTQLRSNGLQMMVVKNTLARKVLEEMGLTEVGKQLQGPTALLFGDDGALGASKVLIPWRKKRKLLAVRGGLLEGRVIESVDVERLALIPEMPVLQAILLSLLQGPMTRLHFAVSGPARTFAALLAALAKKKEQTG